MSLQVDGALVHAMSGYEFSRVRARALLQLRVLRLGLL
jgi:hypothetical protein